jgi:hypothetical protein
MILSKLTTCFGSEEPMSAECIYSCCERKKEIKDIDVQPEWCFRIMLDIDDKEE